MSDPGSDPDSDPDRDDALELVELDTFEGPLFEAWYDVWARSQRHGFGPLATPWQPAELAEMLARRDHRRVQAAVAGLVGAGDERRVVATGWFEGRTQDNVESLRCSLDVDPDHRGRGHGAAVLAELEARARALGRTTLHAETSWLLDDGHEGQRNRDVAWLRHHGFDLGLVDVQRRLDLPVDAGVLDALARDAAEHHAGYALRSWVGPVPDELLDGWAELVARTDTDAPVGDMVREPETPDPGAVREGERLLERQGRTKTNTVALAPDGAVVAYTELVTTVHEPDRAYQWGTLVHADHRGRRLGTAVKVANLRLLQEQSPDVAFVRTFNAAVNRWMVDVNERLGFRVERMLGEFQKHLG